MPVIRAVELTDSVVGEISGYLAVWGDTDNRDAYGTYFDREQMPEMALDFAPFPLLYEHADDDVVRISIIGSVDKVWFDDTGIAFDGALDSGHEEFPRFVSELEQDMLGVSTATGAHLADFDADGRFVSWILAEVSLTKRPAEPTMPNVQLVRFESEQTRSGATRHILTARNSEEQRDVAGANGGRPTTEYQGGVRMPTLEELLADEQQDASVEDILAALVEAFGLESVTDLVKQMTEPADDEMDEEDESTLSDDTEDADTDDSGEEGQENEDEDSITVPAELLQAFTALVGRNKRDGKKPVNVIDVLTRMMQTREGEMPQKPPKAPKRSTGGNIQVSSKFDRLSAPELALGYMLLQNLQPKALRNKMSPVSGEYLRAMAYKTACDIKAEKPAAIDYAVTRSFPFRNPDEVMQYDKYAAIRADELMDMGSGEGDEWIETLQGTSLWEVIREQTPLYARMLGMGMDEAELPVGFDSESIPLEGGDPTWYVATPAVDEDSESGQAVPTYSSSKFGTGEKTVTVAKLSCRMSWPKELEEDSIIPIIREAQRKLQVTATEQIEAILLNGDIDLDINDNINLNDGTPAAAPNRPAYTLLDGLSKLPLITNTANARDADDALDETDFLLLMPMLGTEGLYATELDKVMFVVDNSTYFACLNVAVVKTRDVFQNATIENGVLTRIWGVELLRSGQYGLTEAVGTKSATPGNNTQGRILLVRPDQWAARWKRRLQTDVQYYARADYTEAVAHMRWGLAYRDNEASAISYNVSTTIN